MKMKAFSLFAGLALIVSIAGCGNNNNSTAAGSCQSGQVYSQQYGCLNQGGCPAGQALYNNSCVQTSATGGQCAAGQVHTQYGCLQQAPAGYCQQYGQQYGQYGQQYGQTQVYGIYNNQCVPGTISQTQYGQQCQAGQTYTQFGCLAQGQCPVGQAWYNNTCIQGTNTYNNGGYQQCQAGTVYTQQYGCLPQGNCPMGYALMSNQCIPAGGYSNGGYTGGFGAGFYWGIGVGGGQCPYGYTFYNGMCVR